MAQLAMLRSGQRPSPRVRLVAASDVRTCTAYLIVAHSDDEDFVLPTSELVVADVDGWLRQCAGLSSTTLNSLRDCCLHRALADDSPVSVLPTKFADEPPQMKLPERFAES